MTQSFLSIIGLVLLLYWIFSKDTANYQLQQKDNAERLAIMREQVKATRELNETLNERLKYIEMTLENRLP